MRDEMVDFPKFGHKCAIMSGFHRSGHAHVVNHATVKLTVYW